MADDDHIEEGLELLRAFIRLRDPASRRELLELAQRLAAQESGSPDEFKRLPKK